MTKIKKIPEKTLETYKLIYKLNEYVGDLRRVLIDLYEFSLNEEMIVDLIKDRKDDRQLSNCLYQKSNFDDVISSDKYKESIKIYDFLFSNSKQENKSEEDLQRSK